MPPYDAGGDDMTKTKEQVNMLAVDFITTPYRFSSALIGLSPKSSIQLGRGFPQDVPHTATVYLLQLLFGS
jgi:hypothetical protein